MDKESGKLTKVEMRKEKPPREYPIRRLLYRSGGNNQKRNDLERASDGWYATQRILEGATYRDIARELSEKRGYAISREQVRRDVEKELIEWKRENMENIEAYIARDLARIEEVEKLIMMDYEISKRALSPKDYAALMKRGLTIEEIDEMFSSREHGGDPRYLEVLLRYQYQRMRLLGIQSGNDVRQQTIVNYNFGDLSEDALERMAQELQDAKYKELVDEQ